MKTYLGQIGRFLLLLLAIQIVRALLITGFWRLLHPAPDSPLWAYMDIIAFGLIGISLLLFFHPSGRQLGLEWRIALRWERVAYTSIGILTLGLLISTYFLQADLFVINLNAAITFPIFEELLFCGWGWGQLEEAALA